MVSYACCLYRVQVQYFDVHFLDQSIPHLLTMPLNLLGRQCYAGVLRDAGVVGVALTLFIIGRDDWQRDGPLHEVLIPLLADPQWRIVWEDPAAQCLYHIQRLGWLGARGKQRLTRAFQLAYAAFNPRYA